MSRLSGLRGLARGYFGQLKWRGLTLRKGRWPRSQSVEILEDRRLLSATVVTDQSDYAPGETARINGAGYRTGETIQLQVLHTDGTPNTGGGHDPWYVTDGGAGDLDGTANGQFQTTWYVNPDDSAGSVFELSALGLTSGRLATTTFTDAAVNMEAWENLTNTWTSSVIQPSNSKYAEGGVIPLRFSDLNEAAGSVHTVVLKYDFSGTGTTHFFDWLDTYYASEALNNADATVGIAGLGNPSIVPSPQIPTDTTLPMGAQTPVGVFTAYNIASLSFDPAPQYSLNAGVKALTVHYTVSGNLGDAAKNVAIVYGGHLSTEAMWGTGNGALAFPGASPKAYASLDGGQDKSVSINPKAIVSILVDIAGTTDGSETGPTSAVFTVTQSQATATDTVLTFSLSGTATSGSDYTPPLTITIPAGQTSATITLPVIDDPLVEPTETVVLTLTGIASSSSGVTLGATTSASRNITDNDSSAVSVAVNPTSVLEDGAGNLTYTFTRSNTTANTPALTATFGVTGTATSGTDYGALGTTTVSFAEGISTATITVDPTPDTIVELDETVILTVLAGAGYTVGSPNAATGTITNDDSSTVSVVVSPASVTEDGVTNLVYTFTRSNTTAESPALTVNYSVSGTATTGTDYTGTGMTVTFAAGSSTATVTADPTSDMTVEPNETVILTLQVGSGYTVGTPSVATGTITNDDTSSVSIAVSPLTVAEDGATNLLYTFTRSNTSAETPALTVNYGATGTATTGTDYTGTGTTVTFAVGSSTATVTVDPTSDMDVEPDETVILTVQAGSGYTVGGPSAATGTINNDDTSSVIISVSPLTVAEDGVTNLIYTFTRSNTTAQSPALTVNYGVSGTATTGTDYTGTGTTVIFAVGSSTVTVTVDPTADTNVEPDETVILTVQAGGNYSVGSPSAATGTITNDDTSTVSVAVSPASVLEDGATNLLYTFTRSNTTAQSPALTVNYGVTGTAAAGTDYTGTGTTVTFDAGSSTATVTADPTSDTNVEPDETVILTVLVGASYTIGSPGVATGTITNDDSSGVSVVVSPSSVLEDGVTNLVYTFTRSNTTAQSPTLTVNYGVSGTATTGTDFTGTGTTVTFAAGSSTTTVTVDPTTDTNVEPDETVILTVLAGAGYSVGSPNAATGTITNDDSSTVSVVVSPTSVSEDGATNLVYTFTRSNTTAQSPGLTINYGVSGTATTGTDFTGTSTTVAFAAGSSTAIVTVDPTTDTTVEPDETVILTVLVGAGYSVGSPSAATGTITNDDSSAVSVVVSPASVQEDGVTNLIYTFTRSSTSAETPPLTVNYGVSGTATTGTDYTGTGTTVTFAAGSSTATVTVDPTADTNVEPDETVILTALVGAGYTVGSPSAATGTILNDDTSSVSIAVSPLSVLEDGATNLTYTFTRSNTTAQSPALTVNYGVSGTATTGTDYTGTGTTVIFALGSSTATVTVDPTSDANVEPDETVILTIQAGGSYSVGSPSTATGTITNDDSSTVSVAVSPLSVAEDGATNLTYTFTRSNTTAQSPALTVNYGVTGTATTGTDYTGTGTTVTFALGSSTATVTVDPTSDTEVEPDETVILTVLVGASYTIGSPSVATGTITNDDTSNVSVTVSPLSVLEDGATNLIYTFTRSNTTAQSPSLTVNYTVSGTATTGNDYTGTGTTVFFAVGSSTAIVTVNPSADTNVEPDETVILTVQSGSSYSVGSPSTATGTITDDDTSNVSVAVVAPGSVLEDGATNLVYTFTRSNTTAESPALTVNYGVSGTATPGTDYTGTGTSVTFAAGSNTTTVTVDPTPDSDVEPDETVILTILASGDYTVGSPNAATGTILNDDSSTVSVTVSPSDVAEDGATNLVYTFTRSNTTAESPSLTVNYVVNGTATTGTDYTGTVTTVTFAAGSSTAIVMVDPITDATVEAAETVILAVAAGSNYSVGSPSSASGTITDNDSATVTVNDASVVEGVGLLFTVTLDNAVQGGTVVNVTLSDVTATGGAALVFPVDYNNVVAVLNFTGAAGETKQFTVATLNDQLVEPSETFTVSLDAVNPLITDTDLGTGTITDNDHAPVANPDSVTLVVGGTITVLETGGNSVLTNDSDVDVPAQILHAVLVSGPSHATAFVLNDNGTFSYTHDSSSTAPDSFTYLASDGFNNSNVVTVTITVVAPDILVVGADVGTLSHPAVKVFDAKETNSDGTPRLRFVITPDQTYEPVGTTYFGGVRIGTGDINGDGVADIVTAPGRGKAPDIKVFSGINGALIGSFRAKDLGKSYKKGVYVAVGDVTGDGQNDIVVSPELGKPKVVVYRNTGSNYGTTSGGFSLYSSKKVFSDFTKYVGGATVAVGNVNGDGRAEVIVGSGAGMATLVRAFDVVPTTNPLKGTMTQLGLDIRNSFTGGVYVAAGDLTGDGKAEIVTGSASGTTLAGAGSKVRIYNALTGSELNSFDAFPEMADVPTAAVRVAVSAGKILTAQGPDGRSQYHVRGFDPGDLSVIDSLFAASLQDSDDLNNIGTFQGFPDFFFGGGMFVAANEPAVRNEA